jgi:hypothetical protein
MALNPSGIDILAARASALFAEGAKRDAVIKSLKQQFGGITITACLESDLAEEPFREEPGYYLYLVDSRDHCWKLTREPAHATGVVIAQREDDA